jgi:hypothetical protein
MRESYMSSATPNFWDVKAILDWLTNHRTEQQLQSIHGATFRWAARQQLLDAIVDLGDGGTTFPLIDPSLVGNGQGANTNLVIALRDAAGVDGNGQMPFGGNGDGQMATPLQIETIIRWIDAGCPA